MRLIIREYISMLKESDELEVLLADLVLAMGLTPLEKPGKGSRQFGVDLSAVGVEQGEKESTRKLFLITIKRGHITRRVWDTGAQAVRPSLNEILDSYLSNRLRPEHKNLPKKIIVATSGELKQDVQPDWVNYTSRHTGHNGDYGVVEFDFWDADKLALLIERHMLDEYLFPDSAQKKLRKTIALADQNEDVPHYFYELIEQYLFGSNLPNDKSVGARQKRSRALRLLNLSLGIVFHWCREAENLRPALLCAERAMLRTWDWMRQKSLFNCETTWGEFHRLLSTYLDIGYWYVKRVEAHCEVRNGLFGYGADDELEYPLRTFELVGVLGTIGIAYAYLANERAARVQAKKYFEARARNVGAILRNLIKNNPAALTPRYDGHSIDIVLGLSLLAQTGQKHLAAKWLEEMSGRIVLAYQIGHYFPVSNDSYEDLVAMATEEARPKEKLMELSTLLPMLADWYAIFDRPDAYKQFQREVARVFGQTNLQIWYPDEYTDSYLYLCNAGYETGNTWHSIKLPKSLSEHKKQISEAKEKWKEFEELSCIKEGVPMLGLIASRHFRTPVIPAYWQSIIQESSKDTDLDVQEGE